MTEIDLPYTGFAAIYDEAGHGEYTGYVHRWLKKELKKRKFRGKRLLEIACGTGNLSIALAQEGWNVEGVDVSPYMISEAKRKAREAGLSIRFSRMDMRELAVPGKKDLVVSCYDGLNYLLSEEELSKVFRSAAGILEKDGLFVFDMNTRQAYEKCWASEVPYVVHTDRFTLILEARYNRKLRLGEMNVTGFVRKKKNFTKFVEYHAERPYLKTRVRRLLYRAGFKVEHTETFNPFPACGSRKEPFKALWICSKMK